jgi:hypothetical protein
VAIHTLNVSEDHFSLFRCRLCAEPDKHTDRLIGYGEPVPEAMGSLLDVVGKVPINKVRL